MPELPEVETIAQQLKPLMRGRQLTRIEILDKKLASRDLQLLLGMHILDVRRMGKQVIVLFSSARIPRPRRQPDAASGCLAVHLRMSGCLIWRDTKEGRRRVTSSTVMLHQKTPPGSEAPPYQRAVLHFTGGTLYFSDARRFGTLRYAAGLALCRPTGIEPLDSEFSASGLQQMLQKRKQPIKTWLLRQEEIVGIGNIYAAEILHRAGISPLRRTHRIAADETAKLFAAIRVVLTQAIRHCGTTFSDYQDARGESGGYQRFLRVYDREGQRCRRCRAAVKRIVQGGRSTYYCPGCQK